MITQTIINFFVTVITAIVGLLPNADSGITSQITSNLSAFRTALTSINWFFPVDTALTFMGLIFVIEASIFLWKLIRYIAGIFTLGVLK